MEANTFRPAVALSVQAEGEAALPLQAAHIKTRTCLQAAQERLANEMPEPLLPLSTISAKPTLQKRWGFQGVSKACLGPYHTLRHSRPEICLFVYFNP